MWTQLLLVLTCLAAFFCTITSLRTVLLQSNDTQLFADAFAQYGVTGEDTVLLLPRGQVFSLANVTINIGQLPAGVTAFSSGTLTIMPAPGNSSTATVLDTGQRYALNVVQGVPVLLSRTAKIVVKDLVLINLCETHFLVDTTTGAGWYSALGSTFILGSGSFQGLTFINVIVYIRLGDFGAWTAGLFGGLQSPFPQLYETVAAHSDFLRFGFTVTIALASTLGITYSYALTPGYVATNITLLSSANPTDPLLQSLRARGILQPPTICLQPTSSTLSANSLPLYVTPNAPCWIASDCYAFSNALQQATTQYSTPSTLGIPLVIIAVGIITPSPNVVLTPVPTLANTNMVILGRVDLGASSSDDDAVIDMTGSFQPLLTVNQTGQLYLQSLKYRGLPTSLLVSSGTPSVFPLGVYALVDSSRQVIQAYNVSLELPDLDFLAFMAMALPSFAATLNDTAVSHLEALRSGITNLVLNSASEAPFSIELAWLEGWALNATLLTIKPASRQLAVQVLTSMLLANISTASSSSSSSNNTNIRRGGVIALIILAALLAGAAIGIAVAWAGMRLCGVRILRVEQNRGQEDRTSSSAGEEDNKYQQESPVALLPGVPAVVGHNNMMCLDGGSAIQKGPHARARETQSATDAACDTAPSATACKESSAQYLPERSGSEDTLPQLQRLPPSSSQATLHVNVRLDVEGTPLSSCAPAAKDAPSPPESAAPLPSSLTVLLSYNNSALEEGEVPRMPSSRLGRQDVERLEGFVGTGLQRVSEFGQGVTVLLSSMSSDRGATSDEDWSAQQIISEAAPADCFRSASGRTQADVSRRAFTLENSTAKTSVRTDPKHMISKLAHEIAGDTNKVEVTGVLGEGSWGTVYSGRWRGLDVAVKTMIFEILREDSEASSQGMHQPALMEAAVATSVDHQNVVRTYYYDIKEVDAPLDPSSSSGLHIEDASLGQGRTLRSYKLFLIQERCTLSLDLLFDTGLFRSSNGRSAVIWLLLDIVQGLEYLHARNIVHGDLKPANVLLLSTPTSPYQYLGKLADFGLSARLVVGATHVSNYQSGTPFYVAPEVVLEHRTSPASDIFSLGVIMWQLHTGMLPYDVSSAGHFSWNPKFPSLHDDTPAEYRQLNYRCMMRNPKDRPTASQIIEYLHLILSNDTTATGLTGAP